ncbi:MAG TPA: glycosyltransferase family 2 protein, partial [Cellulomonadaceae bacterium]|nr:glycosyltransferase family 2 protein [Cellulomonadaceae bacterium]
VVTWNGLDLTLRCLDSLRAQECDGVDVELVVVDNGSRDATVDVIQAMDDVRLVALASNTGFAGGVNAGIRATTGDVVVLVNNDAIAEPGFLQHLVAPFTAPGAERVGATTGRVRLSGRFARDDRAAHALVGHDGARWVRVDDGNDSTGTQLLNSTGNEETTSGNGRDRGWLSPADAPAAPTEVFGFNGGSAALRRTALDDVGLFDDTLFMYYEDTELSWRLRRRGWTVHHVHEALTVHDHAASSGTSSPFFLDHNERNRLLVALIHAPWSVVLRAFGRATARAVLGPQRGRRARALLAVAARAPLALRRRSAIDRTATVPRSVPSVLLVPDSRPAP